MCIRDSVSTKHAQLLLDAGLGHTASTSLVECVDGAYTPPPDDDGDPERHPGGVEFCSGTLPSGRSAADHDEDCQPCTVFGAAIGGDGVVTLKDRAAPVTPVVVRTSAGATEHCAIARVVNLSRALDTLEREGYRTVGLDMAGATDLEAVDLTGPVALVVGSEGSGLRRLVRERCSVLARAVFAVNDQRGIALRGERGVGQHINHLGTCQAQRLPGVVALELQRQHTHTHQIGAVNALKAPGHHGLDAQQLLSLIHISEPTRPY